MSRKMTAKLLAAAIVLSPLALVTTASPSAAQSNFGVSFDYFYDELAPYGRWQQHPRWGDVWQPIRVESDFRPYARGHWRNTVEYGWTWNSDYPWGEIPFHYGRWVNDPYDGWLWVPGYVWSPAWVIWRSGGGHIGWFPMPPDDRFLAGQDIYRTDWDWDRGFGYSDWYGPNYAQNSLLSAWIFIDFAHFADRDYYRYIPPRTQFVQIVNNTTNITNYVTVNNRIVNRSIDVAQIERASGRRVERVAARDVVKVPVTPIDVGRQVQVRERERHGGNPNASARERVRPLPAANIARPEREQRGERNRDQQAVEPAVQPAERAAPREREGVAPERAQERQPNRADERRTNQPEATPQTNVARQRETQRQQNEQTKRQRDETAVAPPARDETRTPRGAASEPTPQTNAARQREAERRQNEQTKRQRDETVAQPPNRDEPRRGPRGAANEAAPNPPANAPSEAERQRARAADQAEATKGETERQRARAADQAAADERQAARERERLQRERGKGRN